MNYIKQQNNKEVSKIILKNKNLKIRKTEYTLIDLFDNYINECKYSTRLSSETTRGYKNVFELFLKVMPEVDSLELLNTQILNEFFKRIQTRVRPVGKMYKKGVKASTIKTQRSKLNVFFEWLVKNDYIKENPLINIKAPRVSYKDFRRLTDQDVSKIYTSVILHSTNTFLMRRNTLMISLLLYCGIRKGEFISLKVTDIDLDKKQITIRGETSKSKETRVLPIHPTLLMHIKDYFKERNSLNLRTEQLLVSNRGDRGLTRDGLKHWVKMMIKNSGIRFHLHMFRHTFACKLSENNINIFNIQKLMGHTEIKMTSRYIRSLKTEEMSDYINEISI